MKRVALITLLIVTVFSFLAQAQEIYGYVDEQGTVHFTDQPKEGWRPVRLGGGSLASNLVQPSPRRVAHVDASVPWSDLINAASTRYGLDGHLIAAVIDVESSSNPRVVSHAGAKGLMQLMDGTAEMYGVGNVFDPAENVDAGSRHLRDLLNVYDGNLKLALAAYNAGRGAVARHGGVPPYAETRRYIEKIAARYNAVEAKISDEELSTSYVAARALARGERYIYRYETANGHAYSEVPVAGRYCQKIILVS